MSIKNILHQYSLKTLLAASVLFISAQVKSQGFLKADGQKIVNEKGQNVILRGMLIPRMIRES